MGMLLCCEQNVRDVWSRNEIGGQKLVKFCTLTHAAKLVVEICVFISSRKCTIEYIIYNLKCIVSSSVMTNANNC